MRRSQIKANPESVRAWQQRSYKPLRRRTAKAAANDRALADIKAELLKLNPDCWRCDKVGAVDLHHRALKAGWRKLYVPLLALLCRTCHSMCDSHKAQMRAEHWVLSIFVDWRIQKIPKGEVCRKPKADYCSPTE